MHGGPGPLRLQPQPSKGSILLPARPRQPEEGSSKPPSRPCLRRRPPLAPGTHLRGPAVLVEVQVGVPAQEQLSPPALAVAHHWEGERP